MNDLSPKLQARDSTARALPESPDSIKKAPWEKPKIEDVSEQVMAQPYIRFT
ncbi:MAG TPA: hypothetical protein VMU67_13425 [Steroidobacteraceae bacterium]|nr:hypothetical protein [Steroidobacteraceae bacterium]